MKEQKDSIGGLRPEQKEAVFLQEITAYPTRAGEMAQWVRRLAEFIFQDPSQAAYNCL